MLSCSWFFFLRSFKPKKRREPLVSVVEPLPLFFLLGVTLLELPANNETRIMFLCTSPMLLNIPNPSSALSALFVSTALAAAVTLWPSQLMFPLYSPLSALEKRIPDL